MSVIIITEVRITERMYVIFHLKEKGPEITGELSSDDEIGRITIMTKETSKISDLKGGILVLIEGVDNTVKKAVEIIGSRGVMLKENEASEIYTRMKGENENADQGVGYLFG